MQTATISKKLPFPATVYAEVNKFSEADETDRTARLRTLHDLRRLLGRGQDGRWCGAPIDEIAHAIDDFPSFEAFGVLARLAECLIRARSGPSRSRLACIPNPFYPRKLGVLAALFVASQTLNVLVAYD
jgi:hypothetical protein